VTRVADVVYADDIQAVGRLGPCLKYYTRLAAVGPKYGYNPNPAKTVFVVPEEYVEAVKEHLQMAAGGTLANANVTSSAQYIGAYVGDEAGRAKIVKQKVKAWAEETERLAEVGKGAPQAHYTALTASLHAASQNVLPTDSTFYP
jgi:hypothetical protein